MWRAEGVLTRGLPEPRRTGPQDTGAGRPHLAPGQEIQDGQRGPRGRLTSLRDTRTRLRNTPAPPSQPPPTWRGHHVCDAGKQARPPPSTQAAGGAGLRGGFSRQVECGLLSGLSTHSVRALTGREAEASQGGWSEPSQGLRSDSPGSPGQDPSLQQALARPGRGPDGDHVPTLLSQLPWAPEASTGSLETHPKPAS